MVAKILVQEMDDTPPQICLADHAGDFLPTAANDLRKGTDTEVQLALASVADGAYRQSTKFDYGVHRAEEYNVKIAVELAATPTAGEAIYIYEAPSNSATAGTGNAGNVSGADSDYTGYSSNAGASIKQLRLIGVAVVTAQATTTVQVIDAGRYSPGGRYASIVVRNESGAAVHSDDVECHVVLEPVIPESQ